ncbi:MAG TPA: AmmeMemoRadiSam system protein B [Candidatus Ozemobacteraceae bacterium]|nr:AmmeMemoRadiSam system protein B [Candidatus Ozemobacteraceae bacterium]
MRGRNGFGGVVAALVTAWFLAAGTMPARAIVRQTAVADQFYPGDPVRLERTLDELFAAAGTVPAVATSSKLVGLIVPHAGYPYSGKTAAKAFGTIAGQVFDRIYIMGVDHRSGAPTISAWPDGAYDTPLGPVPVDASATFGLLEAGICVPDPAQHAEEHSIEVVLPFYIRAVGLRPAVFLSIGGGPSNGRLLGRELQRQLTGFPGRSLLIASCDWSHYHPATAAAALDARGLESVRALDPDGLVGACETGATELCGLSGVTALLEVMKAASARVTVLERTDSGEATGDRDHVVGYAAVVFEAAAGLPGERAERRPSPKPERTEDRMNAFHKEALTAVRTTLEAVLNGKPKPVLELKDPRFGEKCGVFVTLKVAGELRGCIGLIEGREALASGIQEMAIAAATEDPRFEPVEAAELSKIDIEISVLSPMIPVTKLEEIEVGRDGLLLRKYPGSGLLLPQVPTEYGWDRDTFLNHLCLKAGLPPGSHLGPDGKSLAPDAKLWRFTAEVFGEKPE